MSKQQTVEFLGSSVPVCLLGNSEWQLAVSSRHLLAKLASAVDFNGRERTPV